MTSSTLTLFVLMACGQERKLVLYSVTFYNAENLSDTIHDEGKNDYEYPSDDTSQWNTMKYKVKLRNMSEILSMLGTDKLSMGPAAIGVSKTENYGVLEDILKQSALTDRKYRYARYEGVDQHGMDCAFFYNPKLFELANSELVSYVYINDTVHKICGFLIVDDNIAGEKMRSIVNHWSSRATASSTCECVGEQARTIKDSLSREGSAAKVAIMRDMNDNPMDKSMVVALGAKCKSADVGPTDLYNPWWGILRKGYGTLMHKGRWNLFGQIAFTGNLLGTDHSILKFYKHEIFRRGFTFRKGGKYKGYPKRTQAGGVWLDGYSNHLPTIIYLAKEVR